MAVAPTGAIYKSLIFDGEDSRDYGVYITGQAVFNAPEREVEMITIPARNGLFALDQGRFENIEVTYPAGIFADTEADFAQAISDFRNALCSKRGYCRLTDDYNTDEYRMAIYKSGLEVSPAQLKAGEFDITFECKPQRFLTSGEETTTMPGKNLIPYPYYDSSGHTSQGITFTVSNDGTVTMNGTASTTRGSHFNCTDKIEYLYPDTEYIMSQTTTTDKSYVIILFYDSSGNAVSRSCSITYDDGTVINASRTNISLDNYTMHKWCKFTFTSNSPTKIETRVAVAVGAGTLNDAKVQPMIRLASDADPNYVRYNGIYNPTLFESSPLLEVEGYGYIYIANKYRIYLTNGVMGRTVISDYDREAYSNTMSIEFNRELFNNGDTITLNDLMVAGDFFGLVSSIDSIAESNSDFTTTYIEEATYQFAVKTAVTPITFIAGTASSVSSTATITMTIDGGESRTITRTITVSYTPSWVEPTSRIYIVITQTHSDYAVIWHTREIAHGEIIGESTVSQIGHPTYIDCELGEAYQKDSGTIVSLNRFISLGSNLPKLEVGQNIINYDNTITDLKIVPRWWKI